MSTILESHLNKFITVKSDEFLEIMTYFKLQTVNKNQNLLEEGQVSNAIYFVLNGILRKFFTNEKGVERTTEFAIENWWMTDHFSYINHSPTEFTIQAVQKTEILVLNNEQQQLLLQKHPSMEKYFRYIYQKAFAASQMRIKFMYDLSREELYHYFKQVQPEFLQRVPQYLIASYLGFTPEYLSEIRRKSIS